MVGAAAHFPLVCKTFQSDSGDYPISTPNYFLFCNNNRIDTEDLHEILRPFICSSLSRKLSTGSS